jgi:hypothetical protein
VIVSTLSPSRERRAFFTPRLRPRRRKLLGPKPAENGRLAPPKDRGIQALKVLDYYAFNRRPQSHLTIAVQRDDFFGIKVQCVCSIAAPASKRSHTAARLRRVCSCYASTLTNSTANGGFFEPYLLTQKRLRNSLGEMAKVH